MRTIERLAAAAILALAAGACTEDADDAAEDGGADTEADAGADAGTDGGTADPITCADFAEGWNEGFAVDGLPRGFFLDLPEGVDEGGPWPVVFSWKGIYNDVVEYRGKIAALVDNETMPFIGVTPEDSDYTLLGTVLTDWQVEDADPETNREARLFDEILACLDERWGVDPDHVHSIGMSLGAIVTDMLGVVRGDAIASIATYSGAYGSNPALQDDWPSMLASLVSWPALDHDNTYTQLFLYGGDEDVYTWDEGGGAEIPFNLSTPHDVEYLNGLGRDAVLCNHGQGHEIPGDQYDAVNIVAFFAAHPLGTYESPYADGLPASFPDTCAFSPSAE